MFALVRFPNEVGNKLYVVPTRNIKDFEPSDDADFDLKTVYQAFWDDPEKESTGFYSAQILVMAEAIIDNPGLKVGGLRAPSEDGKTTTKKFSDANSAVLSVTATKP
ncbi:BEN domain-containing protein 5-like [Ixodes scapularis]